MDSVLSIRNLSIQIKNRVLMTNISFDVNPGDVILLSGTNGVGKSTLLKSILGLDTNGKKISGEILYSDFGNVLSLDKNSIQKCRSKIAYVQQKDEFSEMGNIQVRDIISDSGEAFAGKVLSATEVNNIIDEWIPRKSDNSRVFDAKSKPGKFSGGEQRLLSVLSIIATRPNSDLIIIDEPLNNLDFVNARNISNLLNKVVRNNPKAAVLMVSHCRIFPFITKELKITPNRIVEVTENYFCHSCFGEPNEEGYY